MPDNIEKESDVIIKANKNGKVRRKRFGKDLSDRKPLLAERNWFGGSGGRRPDEIPTPVLLAPAAPIAIFVSAKTVGPIPSGSFTATHASDSNLMLNRNC